MSTFNSDKHQVLAAGTDLKIELGKSVGQEVGQITFIAQSRRPRAKP